MAEGASRPRILITASLDSHFSREVFRGMVTYVHSNTRWRMVVVPRLHAEKLKTKPAGILTLDHMPTIRRFAHRHKLPLIVAGNPKPDPLFSSVSVDENFVGVMAAEYLGGLGLKHFAFVGHGDWPFLLLRRDGFVKAVRDQHRAQAQQLVGKMETLKQRTRFERDIERFLLQLPRPCGVLAANDSLGAELVSIALGLGLRVPDDIAIMGVDDDQLSCELSDTPLSSVAQPLFAIGYEAARLLDQRLSEPDLPPSYLLLPPMRVAARASTDLVAIDDIDVASAMRLIREHATENIGVDWIIRQLPVARRSLERKFKTLTGRTMLQQIHLVRFEKAKQLLSESDLALELVAQRSGFSNARWLTDCFRNHLNTTPNRFRRQYRTES